MAQGEFALVNEHLAAALHKPPFGWNPVGDHEIYVLLADVAAHQRDETMLAAYAARAEEISSGLGHTLYQAMALRALAILDELHGEMGRAQARLKESLRLFQRMDTRWQMGRTLVNLGELSAAAGKVAEARNYFSQAAAAFEEMGAHSAAERARSSLKTP